MLAALDFKLGTCYVGAFDDFAIRRILKIPDNLDIEAVITIGYPDEEEREKKYGIEIITSINEFGNAKLPDKSPVKDILNKLKKR